jgi:hypothetical protein
MSALVRHYSSRGSGAKAGAVESAGLWRITSLVLQWQNVPAPPPVMISAYIARSSRQIALIRAGRPRAGAGLLSLLSLHRAALPVSVCALMRRASPAALDPGLGTIDVPVSRNGIRP